MRLVFAGTPDFAVPALDALVSAGHHLAAVCTQPDRPAGRGQKFRETPVARRAKTLGLPVLKPEKLDESAQAQLRALTPELIVVVAYGLILPQAVLDIPPHGCVNIHASLLPRWRGAAPIQRAILAGDRESGITIMKMDSGLDTGPILLHERVAIDDSDTAGDLHDRLAALGAKLIVEAVNGLAAGKLRGKAQPAKGATYAARITKDEARIDWSQPAESIARQVRAFNPVPVAWTELDGERVRIQRAHATDAGHDADPGCVLDNGPEVAVAAGKGILRIASLQRPGGRTMTATDALRGWNIAGKRFR